MYEKLSTIFGGFSKIQRFNIPMGSNKFDLITKNNKNQDINQAMPTQSYCSPIDGTRENNCLATFSSRSFRPTLISHRIDDAKCPQCDAISQDQRTNIVKGYSKECVCKTNVQYLNMKHCDGLFEEAGLLSASIRSKDFNSFTGHQSGQNTLMELAQAVKLFFIITITNILSHAFKIHSTQCAFPIALTALLLIFASASCDVLAGEASEAKGAAFSPCSHVMRSTSRQVYTRHPGNCSIFYMCYGNQHWELSCTQNNTVFSMMHSVCVWKGSKYDDCNLPATGLTTAYAWNRVPHRGNDGKQKFAKKFQRKFIDVIVSSTKNGEESANETISISESDHPKIDTKNKSTTIPKGPNNLWEHSKNAVIELAKDSLINGLHNKSPNASTDLYSQNVPIPEIKEQENNTDASDILEELSIAKGNLPKIGGTQRPFTQHKTSDQLFRGYSVQYPTFDKVRSEHLETDVYKSSKIEGSRLDTTLDKGDNLDILEVNDDAKEKTKREYDNLSQWLLSNDVTSKVQLDVDESSYTTGNNTDADIHAEDLSEMTQDSTDEEPKIDTTRGILEMENGGTTINNDKDAPLNENIDNASFADSRVLKAALTEDENVDNLDPDKLKYREIYIRDRWPKFDRYGTRYVSTEQPDNQDDEILSDNTAEKPKDKSDGFISYKHGGRGSWLPVPKTLTTREPLLAIDATEYKLNTPSLFNLTLLRQSDRFLNGKARMESDSDISEQYNNWNEKISLRISSETTTDALNTYQYIQSISKPTSPTLRDYDNTENKSRTYRLIQLIQAKLAADKKTAKSNSLKDSKGKRNSLAVEPFKMNTAIDVRFPFGRPWERLYPGRVESSSFKSTLKPTHRPSPLQQKKASDNPKLMEQFLRLLNSPKPGNISSGTQLSRNNSVLKETQKDVRDLDKKAKVRNLFKATLNQPVRPQKNVEFTTNKQTKPNFTFSKPTLTWKSKRRNFNQSIFQQTRVPWSRDRLSGTFDSLKPKYHVNKVQNVINTNTPKRVLPSYKFVPATQRAISGLQSTLKSPKQTETKTPLGRDQQKAQGLRPGPLLKTTRQPIPRQTPPKVNQAPTQWTFPRQNVQQTGRKLDSESKKAQLQKLREKHVQSLQKPSKQNYFPGRQTPSFLTSWYPTNFNVLYQMYKPFVNNKHNQQTSTQRTTLSNNDFILKRNNHQGMSNPNNAKIWEKSTSRNIYKFTSPKTKQDTKFVTPAPRISQKKLDILRQLTPKLWNLLIPDSRRRDLTKPVFETTTMQIYVKPTFSPGQKQDDVSDTYWWDRNTRGPKYFVPTLPVTMTTQRPTTTTLATTQPPRTTTSTIPTTSSTTPITTSTTTTTTAPITTTTLTTTSTTTPEPTFIVSTSEPEMRTKKWPPFVAPDYVPEYRKEMQDRCGIMGRPLIIGGRKSRSGQWPWQVSLQIVTSTTPWHRCGGVLVHARWVLTAAHCVEGSFYGDIRNWRVVLADYDLDTVSGNEIYREVVRIISHPEYVRTSNFPNDIALLELDSPVDLTSGEVQTACLPDSSMPLGAGTQCWISGWGETRGSGGNENMMNEVPVDVVSNQECQGMWGKVNIDVLESQVCLGYGDTGACYGDSGGPLMCEDQGRFYVAGVMSWLINNCSATNFPNVFTRLPNYMDWVYEHLDYFEWLRYL